MERQSKDGTFYTKVGEDQWSPVTRTAKDGTVYKKVGEDQWSPLDQPQNVHQDNTPQANPIASGARKFIQGATAGFSDEAAGAVEAAGRALGFEGAGAGPMKDIKVSPDGATLDWETLRDAYINARDKERANLKKDSKDNPKISSAAEFAGAIASPINKVAPGANIAQKGLIYGGISGLGSSEANNIADAIKDSEKGAIIGGLVGKTVEAATPLIQKAATKAGESAETFAARALGAERASVKKIGIDKAKEVGRYALDEKLLSPMASTEDIVARNEAVKKAAGKKMDQVYSAIDDAGKSTFNPQKTAEKVNEELGGFWRSPINKGQASQLDNTLESILVRADGNGGNISLKEAQALKQELGKAANWKNNINISDKEQMARDAYKIVSDHIDDAVESGAKEIGSKDLLNTLTGAKGLYSNAKGAEAFLQNKTAKEAGNQFFGLKDSIGATTGATIGAAAAGPVGAAVGSVAGAAGGKAVSKYGAQNAALALDKVSKLLSKTPEFAQMAENNPKAFQAIVEKITPHFENTSQMSLPKAADNSPTKGPEKWANDGIENILKSQSDIDRDTLEKLKSSTKGKELLIEASEAKNKKAMDNIIKRIRSASAAGGE